MQLSNIPGKLVLPFANAGGKNAIPVDSQIGITAGAASLVDGFPPLTRTPIAAGGVPPSGLDMNGVIYELSAAIRWANAGGGYPFDSAFATDTNVGGYPKGARIMRADGAGYWYNTTDNNVTDPESSGAADAGWVPDFTTGVAAVTMTSANVTLTPAQYGKPTIVITGALTGNLNLIFPNITGQWDVINGTTGGYTITAKTAAGTGSGLSNNVDQIFGDGTNIYNANSFKQSGTGAVVRTMNDKVKEHVSVKDFGAVGDGVTDDTSAIQKALDTSAMHVHFPAGIYRITDPLQDGTPSLVSNQVDRRITCDGYITATSIVLRALGIYGANSYVQLNVKGNSFIAEAIRVYAGGCVVEGCRISDLSTTTYSAVAIGTVEVNDGIVIRNNIIKNLYSAGDGTLGNGNGMSRAVALGMTANATSESIVEGNVIEDILGEEGDAITIISSNGAGTYYDARVTVRDNTIKNFTRRAIKVQANRTHVRGNYITHTFASAAEVPNRITVIDFVQGGNHQAVDNVLDGCKWFVQFSVFAVAPETFSDFVIENNKVLGLGAETTNGCISIQPLGSNVFIRGNQLTCGTGRAISVGSITNCVIENNTISAADNAAERVISTSGTVTKGIIKGNVLFSGVRQCFIGCDSNNTVIVDNHLKCDTPFFRNAAGSSNSLVAGNSIDGTAFIYSDTDSLTGNRLGGNYYFQNQAVMMPAPMFTATNGGPAVAFAGVQVRAGQIVFDSSPTAGSYIGWVATTDGDAATVTWKQFGAILA